MITDEMKIAASKAADEFQQLPLTELADWLIAEKGLGKVEALFAARQALRFLLTPKTSAEGLQALREYVLAGRPLSPIADMAKAVGMTRSAITPALHQLAAEGLVSKIHPPGLPAYVSRWVRRKATKP